MVIIKDKHKNILERNLSRGSKKIEDIFLKWCESWRYYHNLEHLSILLDEIDLLYQQNNINEIEYEQLVLISFFHDIIYYPGDKTNELNSIEYYIESIQRKIIDYDRVIIDAIYDTISHDPKSEISKIFCELDMQVIYKSDLQELINYGKKIYKEFQCYSFDIFRDYHIKFISQYQDINPNIKSYIEYLENWIPNIGVFAGKFSPLHIGHMDIIEKASKIFDKVIIVKNSDELSNNFDILKNKLLFYQVEGIRYHLSDFITEQEELGQSVTLIRGIRDSIDLDDEVKTVRFIKDQKPDLKVVFIPSDEKYSHISSTRVKLLQSTSKADHMATKYLI